MGSSASMVTAGSVLSVVLIVPLLYMLLGVPNFGNGAIIDPTPYLFSCSAVCYYLSCSAKNTYLL
jgi:hypothetical protein